MIDFEQVKNATSDDFVDFVKETLLEWQVDNYIWRLDTAWAGEVFLHVLVDKEKLDASTTTQLMQFVYRSGVFEFQSVNSDALKWLKGSL